MRKRYLIVGVAVAGVVALVIAAAGLAKVGSSKSATVLPASSCSSLQYGGSGSPKFIVASDLPLQGSSRAQTIEMTKAIAVTRSSRRATRPASTRSATSPATTRRRRPGSGIRPSARRTRATTSATSRSSASSARSTRAVPRSRSRSRTGHGRQYVSPANTYIGLTHKPALPGEPQKYYPTGKRNYARVVAADDFQGAADATAAQALKAKKSTS